MENSKFQTIINTTSDIIVLSDIHADIDAFIICLRDCAKVIKMKNDDYELSELLNLELPNENYIDDLNFEWCGEDTIVVIIGDLIDGKRFDSDDHYYPQCEIKLLRFINALYNQGGNIIKLCGNHEFMNFQGDNTERFIFTQY